MEARRIKTNEWQVFKSLRLPALKGDGDQFGQSYDKMKEYGDERWKEDTRKAAVSDEFYIVIGFEEQKPIGMSACIKRDDFGKIIAVWVEPESRGSGMGRVLVEETMNVVQSKTYELTVVDGNMPAISTYESLGFKTTGFSYVNSKGFREIEMIREPNRCVEPTNAGHA